jgi:hypothetical protein
MLKAPPRLKQLLSRQRSFGILTTKDVHFGGAVRAINTMVGSNVIRASCVGDWFETAIVM